MPRGLRRWGQGLLSTARDGLLAVGDAERWLSERVAALVTAAAFWVAIPLPFLYIPVLAAGVDSRAEGLALLVLVGLHVVTLGLGHPYATRQVGEE
ncbi:hypothetical protein [Halorientalis marina]|uniref:hypothetical protein n=1 Tax=Halorientalis marina TaxID=2931976 RepID=UPI001FF4E842|nr:hypothetical protein [Halorientalis marina]